MRFCQIVPSLEEKYGGPSRSVLALSSALAAGGDEVELLTTHPRNAAEATEGRLKRHTFKRDWPGKLCPSRGMREYLRRTSVDVVHHHSLWLRTLHYANCHSSNAGIPLIVSPRGMMSDWAWQHRRSRKTFARSFVHPNALEAVNAWHATSSAEAEEIRARGFKQPICIAPNGVHFPSLQACATAEAHWRSVCGSDQDRQIALFYSRLHPKKRVLELIDLWLTHSPRDWLLVIVGVPETYSIAELRAGIRRVSGSDRIKVFDGNGQPPPYAVASLFLLPSHNENFGLVVAEAMAHGVPVLVTDTTPWSIVNDHDAGWCVPWERFGETLAIAFNEDASALRERGRRARACVEKHFTWERSAVTLSSFYRELSASLRAS